MLEAGAELEKLMEMEGTGGGSLGRAEQANCTLLAAGRFLIVVMGGAPGGSGSQPAPHCTCAGQPMGQEVE